jgi:hypothetical protein
MPLQCNPGRIEAEGSGRHGEIVIEGFRGRRSDRVGQVGDVSAYCRRFHSLRAPRQRQISAGFGGSTAPMGRGVAGEPRTSKKHAEKRAFIENRAVFGQSFDQNLRTYEY